MPKRVVAPKKKIAKKKRPLNAYFKAMMKAKNRKDKEGNPDPAESFEYNGNTYVKDFVLPPNAKPGQQPLLVYKKQV